MARTAPGARKKRDEMFSFTDKRFASYSVAIGQALLAWNYLHERMGNIFFFLTSTTVGRTRDIWYSSSFDRPRREMLKSLFLEAPEVESAIYRGQTGKMKREIYWLISETQKLEEVRNDIVHSPLVFNSREYAKLRGFKEGVTAADFQGNPRAINLSKKDLLIEYRWFRDRCMLLGDFAWDITSSIVSGASWPDRPRLPSREQQKRRRKAV